MAVGKNKKPGKSKKGGKKKLIDPFSKKDWYDVKAPAPFAIRQVGANYARFCQSLLAFAIKHSLFYSFVPLFLRSLPDLTRLARRSCRARKARVWRATVSSVAFTLRRSAT
jgi:hypothetical protein